MSIADRLNKWAMKLNDDDHPDNLFAFITKKYIVGEGENTHIFPAKGQKGVLPQATNKQSICGESRGAVSSPSVCFTKRGARHEALQRQDGVSGQKEDVCGVCVSHLYSQKK